MKLNFFLEVIDILGLMSNRGAEEGGCGFFNLSSTKMNKKPPQDLKEASLYCWVLIITVQRLARFFVQHTNRYTWTSRLFINVQIHFETTYFDVLIPLSRV